MKKDDGTKKKVNHKFVSKKALLYIHLDKIDEDEKESKDNFNLEHKYLNNGDKNFHTLFNSKGRSTKNIHGFKKSNFKKKSLFKSEKKLNLVNDISDVNDNKTINSPFKIIRSNIFKNTDISNFNSIDNTSNDNGRVFLSNKKKYNQSSKNLYSFKNKLNNDEDDNEFNTINFKGVRKKYLAIGKSNSNKKKFVQFSKNKYFKSSKSISIAGKDGGKKK